MNTDLTVTKTDEQALAILAGLDLTPGGMENVRQEDVAQAPRIRISAQNRPLVVADKEIPVGDIANTLTGQNYGNTVEVVFLRFMPDTNVMWPREYSADNDPLCASDNGEMPSQSTDQRQLRDPQGGPCADCKFAQFDDDSNPPACKRQRNFLVWLVETQETVLFTAQSTGLKPAKTLTNLAVSCNVTRSIWLSTRKESGDKGTWFVMTFTKGEKVAPSISLGLHHAKEDYAKLIVVADIDGGGNGGSNAPPTETVQSEPGKDLPF